MKTFVVTSDLGERRWQADDAGHAREQHLDAFPDEPILAIRDESVPVTQDPDVMPASVHGETVVSAFRHLPLYGLTDDTYTVITRGENNRYSVFRARFAPGLGRWSIDTGYRVDSGLSWTDAASEFAQRVTDRVS